MKKSGLTGKKLKQRIFQRILIDYSILINKNFFFQILLARIIFFQDGVQDGRRNPIRTITFLLSAQM